MRNRVLIGFLLAIVSTIILTSFSKPGSKKNFPSPDGRHVATVCVWDTGVTTGPYADLTLRRPREWFGRHWNVLSQGPGRPDAIQVEWMSNDKLSVTYKSYEEWKAPSPTNVDGVLISFKHDDLGYSNQTAEMEREDRLQTNRLGR